MILSETNVHNLLTYHIWINDNYYNKLCNKSNFRDILMKREYNYLSTCRADLEKNWCRLLITDKML